MARAYKNRQQLEAPVGKYGAGVYAILNSNSGKVYVGSSVRMRHRWTEHRCELEDACHGNRYLQRAFAKEPGAFQVEVLEELKQPDKEALLGREQFWINFFRSWIPEHGYNIAPKAESCRGVKHPPGYGAAISARQLGVKWSEERKAAWKIIRPLTQPRGWKWSPEVLKKLSDSHKGLKWSESQRAARLKWMANNPAPSNKRVSQYSLDGLFIKSFDSITHAENEVAGRRTNIHAVCKGKRPHCLGFIWKYA